MLWRPRSAVHCAQSVGNKIGRHVYVYRRGLAYLLACLCDANTITNDSFLRRKCFSAWRVFGCCVTIMELLHSG
jgi:hypothetical protein